ncbi:DUF948 domain-containing protein, partial [Pseudarthrobacter oxydans]|uniref:DUF948 domain-containing protein n=1 Tax=Pseudarthrobacter oxydans TaxID=1671 RepID=UPI00344CD558
MSVGALAGLIAAVMFALLVLLLAVPIMKLGQVLDEVRIAIRSLSEGTTPLMAVNGHYVLPMGGQLMCPLVASKTARLWPTDLP